MGRFRFSYTVIIIFIILSTRVGFSQPHALFYNSYVALAAGPNCYFSPSGQVFGVGADITAGKWILSTTGLRTQFAMQLANSSQSPASLHPYWYGHVDICFDILTAFKGRSHSNTVRSYTLLGVGIVHSSTGDNDFCGAVGIGADFRISPDWRLFAELQSLVHPSDFDYNNRSSVITTLRLGAMRDIAYNPTRSRTPFESNRFVNDWFFNVSFGANNFRYRREADDSRINCMPIFEFAIGKRLNGNWQIRLSASGLYARSSEERFSYYHLHGDLMGDIASMISATHINSQFTVRPYLSAGLVTRLDDPSNFLFSPAAGFQVVVRPLRNHEVFLDTRYVVTPPRFAHVSTPQGTLSVGIATIMVGYSYTFSKNSFR